MGQEARLRVIVKNLVTKHLMRRYAIFIVLARNGPDDLCTFGLRYEHNIVVPQLYFGWLRTISTSTIYARLQGIDAR